MASPTRLPVSRSRLSPHKSPRHFPPSGGNGRIRGMKDGGECQRMSYQHESIHGVRPHGSSMEVRGSWRFGCAKVPARTLDGPKSLRRRTRSSSWGRWRMGERTTVMIGESLAKFKADSEASSIQGHMRIGESAFERIYDNRFRLILQGVELYYQKMVEYAV